MATLAVGVPAGQFVSATATDSENNTSQFAQSVVVTAGGGSDSVHSVGNTLLGGFPFTVVSLLAPGGPGGNLAIDAGDNSEARPNAAAVDVLFSDGWPVQPGVAVGRPGAPAFPSRRRFATIQASNSSSSGSGTLLAVGDECANLASCQVVIHPVG
jgi:hypothetical protein